MSQAAGEQFRTYGGWRRSRGMGLFGLVTFSTEQRRKEISVRKVLGASVNGLVALLVKDLLKLVIIAVIIASPVAWFAMRPRARRLRTAG